MSLFRRTPPACSAPRCGRAATSALSNGPQRALSCGYHISTFESRWGQVFIRSIP